MEFLAVFTQIGRGFRTLGAKRTIKQFITMSVVKPDGKLVGVDLHGNEYYEDDNDMFNHNRWVLYKKWNLDPTSIPPEWHQWLHRTSDIKGDQVPKAFYTSFPYENVTGSFGAYKPYNTTLPKYEGWKPQIKDRK